MAKRFADRIKRMKKQLNSINLLIARSQAADNTELKRLEERRDSVALRLQNEIRFSSEVS